MRFPPKKPSHAHFASGLGRTSLRKTIYLCTKCRAPSQSHWIQWKSPVIRDAKEPANMHRRAWLAYAAVSGLAFPATVPRPSQSEDSLATIPLTLISSGNLSAAKTADSSLNDITITNQLSLNNTASLSSNFSISLLNLPFGYNLPTVTSGVPQCNGDVYGTNLDRHSCFDAWQNMGWTPERVSWGPRGTAHDFQYRLPYRWSSGEYSIKT